MHTLNGKIDVIPVPIRKDNYVWVVAHQARREAFIVDPGDASEVLDYLAEHRLKPIGILITHSHNDHTGGITDITNVYPIPVYGPKSERIPQVTHTLYDGNDISLWADYQCTVIHTPGHLPEHIVYFIDGPHLRAPLLMCADILFSSGCGRMFVGTPEEFAHSLSRIAALPKNTLIYPAHEYTLANLDFAEYIEPGNAALQEKRQNVTQQLEEKGCSLPSSLDLELKTNPFMRCGEHAVVTRIADLLPEGNMYLHAEKSVVFAALRKMKDTFC